MEKENIIEYKVYGRYALFTDPLTKLGGERFSYQIPTYQALKGITESIYWKPTFQWYIDEVRIMKPINTKSQGIRPIHYYNNENDLSIYTYLKDVEYQVKAHFEWNENREDTIGDRDENKHFLIAKRMVKRGGRRDIFLGTRECQGYVEPCVFGEGEGHYDNMGDMPFGVMLHGITYPDEAIRNEEKGKMTIRFWEPVMKGGCIKFKRPEECSIRKITGNGKVKEFGKNNFSGLDEFEKAGVFNGVD
ncbi:MAG: type I-C CRISPR-associated protein Cas5c [Clostridiales bacterium]|jgi:CRISPR-associated protein Cas5d|nr:type I-C CRISPR-associated protein Cas5c [Clostridiales bacterium]